MVVPPSSVWCLRTTVPPAGVGEKPDPEMTPGRALCLAEVTLALLTISPWRLAVVPDRMPAETAKPPYRVWPRSAQWCLCRPG